jgi:amidase
MAGSLTANLTRQGTLQIDEAAPDTRRPQSRGPTGCEEASTSVAIDQELAFASTVELSDRLRRRELSATELLDVYLERINRLEPQLNAFVEVFEDSARADAVASDARLSSGDPAQVRPLEGLPIPVKDLIMVAGRHMGFGTRLSPPFPMPQDSELVARLRAAGAVLTGRTTLPELGTIPSTECDVTGQTHNPWNLAYSPGGSSGGSGAAVAAGLAPAAHGSDGGGSLRVPASVCGLFTLKPTRGLISRDPLEDDFALTVDGFLTRTVADNARLLDVVAGSVPGDPYFVAPPRPAFAEAIGSAPRRLRIGLATSAPVDTPIHPACVEAARNAAAVLSDLGHDVVEATPPWREDALVESFLTVWSMVIATGLEQLAAFGGGSIDQAEPHNRALHAMAKGLDATQIGLALAAGRGYCRRVMAFYRDHDALLTPTLGEPPWKLGEIFSGSAADPMFPLVRATPIVAFTALVNLAGQPAVSLPLGEHEGMPVGVQIAGRLGDDALLLQLAAQVEAAAPWGGRRSALG